MGKIAVCYPVSFPDCRTAGEQDELDRLLRLLWLRGHFGREIHSMDPASDHNIWRLPHPHPAVPAIFAAAHLSVHTDTGYGERYTPGGETREDSCSGRGAMRGQCGVAIVAATLVDARDAKFAMNPPGSIGVVQSAGASPLEATAVAGRRQANPPSSPDSVKNKRPSWVLPVRRRASQEQQLERQQQDVLQGTARHARIKEVSTRPARTPATGDGGRRTTRGGRVRIRGFIGPTVVAEGRYRPRSSSSTAEGSAAAVAAGAGGYGKLPLLRGGAHGTASWLSGGGEQYLEFPDDFDYEDDSDSASGGGSSSMEDGGNAYCWSEEEEEEPMDNAAAVATLPPRATSKLGLGDGADGASPATPRCVRVSVYDSLGTERCVGGRYY